jgi:geranylgeranylglycerol-phosphate geranylgeranyltransferase
VLAVIVGQILALGRLPEPVTVALASLPPLLIGLASFAINDFFDVETDRKNRRNDRPLVNGSATKNEAYFLAIGLFFLGVLLSFALPAECYFLAGIFAIVAFLYSYTLKDFPLVGNLYIASTMAVPFIYGSYSVSQELGQGVVVLALIAFVTGMAREIAGDVRDAEGDKARDSRTLPFIVGRRNAVLVQSLLYLLAVAMSAYPYLFVPEFAGDYKYLVPIAITDLLIVYSAVSTITDSSVASFRRSRNVSLAALGIGLLGFLLGSM